MDAVDHRAAVRAEIEALPRVMFLCRRDLWAGPDHYMIGVQWKRDLEAKEYEIPYKRRLVLHFKFRVRLNFGFWMERY